MVSLPFRERKVVAMVPRVSAEAAYTLGFIGLLTLVTVVGVDMGVCPCRITLNGLGRKVFVWRSVA